MTSDNQSGVTGDQATEQKATEATINEDQLIEKLMGRLAPMITGAVKNHVAKQVTQAQAKEPDPPKGETELEAMRREHNALKQQLRQQARASKEAELFNQLQGSLTGKVKAGSELTVAKYLAKAEGMIALDDMDRPVIRYAGEDFDSLSEGVNAFLRSPEAANFIPAPNATQSAKVSKAPAAGNGQSKTALSKAEQLEAYIKANSKS